MGRMTSHILWKIKFMIETPNQYWDILEYVGVCWNIVEYQYGTSSS